MRISKESVNDFIEYLTQISEVGKLLLSKSPYEVFRGKYKNSLIIVYDSGKITIEDQPVTRQLIEKFVEGKEETAADIIKEVKKEEEKEKPSEKPKEEDKTKVPTAHDLKKQEEEKNEKEEKKRKEVEELTKELLKKGTLRKK